MTNDSLARIAALAGVVLVLAAFAGGGFTYGLLSDQEDGSVSIEAAANFATETTTTSGNTDTTTMTTESTTSTVATEPTTSSAETDPTSTTADDSSGTTAANDASVDLLVGSKPNDPDSSDLGPSDAGSDAGGWGGTSAARDATGTPITDRGVDAHE